MMEAFKGGTTLNIKHAWRLVKDAKDIFSKEETLQASDAQSKAGDARCFLLFCCCSSQVYDSPVETNQHRTRATGTMDEAISHRTHPTIEVSPSFSGTPPRRS